MSDPAAEISSDPAAEISAEELTMGGFEFILQSENFVGPLPHPDTLQKYQAIHPGIAELILQEYKHQGRHRRDLETRLEEHDYRLKVGSQVGTIVLGTVFASIAGILIATGNDVSGLLIFFGEIIALVAVNLRRPRKESSSDQVEAKDDEE